MNPRDQNRLRIFEDDISKGQWPYDEMAMHSVNVLRPELGVAVSVGVRSQATNSLFQ